MSKPRYHVATVSGYPMGGKFTGASRGREVDAYVMNRHYNDAVVATFRKGIRAPQTLGSTRDYVAAQAQAVADVLNKLDA